MKRDNAKEYYYFSEDFYRSVLYDLKHNSLIFYAVFEEKIVAMSIVLFVNQKCIIICHVLIKNINI